MSHIIVHRIEDLARRRIGRTAQIDALPPQQARHVGNHWQLNRRSFAHAAFLNMLPDRVGKEDPVLKAAKQAALDAGIALDLVNTLTLDQVMVTPDSITTTIGGRTITTLMRAQRLPNTKLSAVYEPLLSGSIARASIAQANYTADRGTVLVSQASFPSEAWLESLHISAQMLNGPDAVVTVEIEGIGVVFTSQLDNFGEQNIGPVNIPLQFVMEHTGTLKLSYELKNVALGDTFSALALLAWKDVKRVS